MVTSSYIVNARQPLTIAIQHAPKDVKSVARLGTSSREDAQIVAVNAWIDNLAWNLPPQNPKKGRIATQMVAMSVHTQKHAKNAGGPDKMGTTVMYYEEGVKKKNHRSRGKREARLLADLRKGMVLRDGKVVYEWRRYK